MHTRTHLTIAAAAGLIAVSFVVAFALRATASPLAAVITYFLIYWAGCIGLAACLAPTSSLRTLYRSNKGYSLTRALAWTPAVVTLAVAFLPSVALLSAGALLAIAVFAFVNGTCEELFWRATFVAVFPAALPLGFILSCVLFTLAHIPLLLLPGISFSGGPTALLLGAAALGVLWAWLAWQVRDLRSVTAAHVATNFFAFAGFVADNWPSHNAA